MCDRSLLISRCYRVCVYECVVWKCDPPSVYCHRGKALHYRSTATAYIVEASKLRWKDFKRGWPAKTTSDFVVWFSAPLYNPVQILRTFLRTLFPDALWCTVVLVVSLSLESREIAQLIFLSSWLIRFTVQTWHIDVTTISDTIHFLSPFL